MGKFYAVRNGYKIGIFTSWEECKAQVDGYSRADYKSFLRKEDAEKYLAGDSICNTFDTTNKDTAVAYVDGNFNVKTGIYGSGVVILHHGFEKNFSQSGCHPDVEKMHNVAGEIYAAMYAMEYCRYNKIPTLNLYFDYEGIEKWCTGKWKAKNKYTKKYKKFYDSLKNKLKVNFIKVKAHSGNTYNDKADKLAKWACSEGRMIYE